MKRFIKKVSLYFLFLLFLIISLSIVFFSVIVPQYKYNYNAALSDKIERLESIEEPKIILVGNSNLAFGVNSETIEREIGMPVVNLGLHGSMGNAFHEKIATFNINKGDIVVICHTSYSDDNKIEDYPLAWITFEDNFHAYRLLGSKDYWGMLCAYPNYVKEAFQLWITRRGNSKPSGVYSRLSFNKYGDVALSRPENEFEFGPGTITVPEINNNCTIRINKFNKYCEKQGARLVIAGFPIASGEYTPPQENFVDFQNELDKKLECDIISNFTDYFIEYKYFYDTKYHLTDEGVSIRTAQLISDLKNWLETQ